MAWEFVSKATAATFCQVSQSFLLDEYSDMVEGLIKARYKYDLGQGTKVETLDGTGRNIIELNFTPVHSLIEVAIVGPTDDGSGVSDIASNAVIDGKFVKLRNGIFPKGFANVRITYVGGTDEVDNRLMLAELAALSYITKYLVANRGDDTIKFSSSPGIGSNQYSPRPGFVTKIMTIMDEVLPRKVKFA